MSVETDIVAAPLVVHERNKSLFFLGASAFLVGQFAQFPLIELLRSEGLLRATGGTASFGDLTDGVAVAAAVICSMAVEWAVIMIGLRRRADRADILPLCGWPKRRALLAVLGAGLAMTAATALFERAMGWPDETPVYQTEFYLSAARNGGLWGLALLWSALVLAGPFAEEIVFRGVAFAGLRREFGSVVAVAVTAALWAAVHLQYGAYDLLGIFGAGVLLGWARIVSGGIAFSFVLHAAANLVATAITAARLGWPA